MEDQTWSDVRRIDQDNTATCIEPGQTGWVHAFDDHGEWNVDSTGDGLLLPGQLVPLDCSSGDEVPAEVVFALTWED